MSDDTGNGQLPPTDSEAIPTYNELTALHQNICQALADPKRIQILYALSQQARNVTSLAQRLDSPQSTISRHLAVLRRCNLVQTERANTSITYSLRDKRIITILDQMRGMLNDLLRTQVQHLGNSTDDNV